MKKRLLIGTLIIATVLMITYVIPVFALRRDVSLIMVGKGTATHDENSVKAKISIHLVVTQITVDSIGGVGKGHLIVGNLGPADVGVHRVEIEATATYGGWSIDRNTKELEILGIVLARDRPVGLLELSGTLVRNPGKAPRASVELLGTLSWQTEIVSMEIVASIFADAPDYDWMDL